MLILLKQIVSITDIINNAGSATVLIHTLSVNDHVCIFQFMQSITMTNNDPKTYFLGDTCFSAMFKGNLRPKHRGLLQTFLAMHNYVGHAVIVPTIKARDRPLQVRQGIENQTASAFL